MNITFLNNKVFKLYDSENTSELLTLRFLKSDYSLDVVKDFFDQANIADVAKEIIKTNDEGTYVCTFSNYTVVSSVAEMTVDVVSESTKEIASLNESGEEITTSVPTTETKPVELVVVVLKYVDPTVALVGKLDKQLNPTIDVETCTLDELKAWQKKVVNEACTAAIYYGVDVTLSDKKTYHFSYKADDQQNYTEMYQEIMFDNYTKLPYHSDNGDCTVYSAEDMKTIIRAERMNKFVLTTRCNAYHGMIKDATDKEAVLAVTWGSDLSADRQKAFDKMVADFQG